MEIFDIKLVGTEVETLKKFVVTVLLILIVFAARKAIRFIIKKSLSEKEADYAAFWARQIAAIVTTLLLVSGTISIWLDDPARLTTAMGLATAGIAFALQKPISAIAGYFVILRGNTFSIGDLIRMGNVRGEVIDLGFTQTTIMEIGQTPREGSEGPTTWVRSRQFTGRLVTVSNGLVFDEPVYNYSRDFPTSGKK